MNITKLFDLCCQVKTANGGVNNASLPVMMQQAVALQQMQFQQALAMQQAASAQAAAARAATMKSATEAAAARAKEISMKLKAEGFPAGTGGVEVDGEADGNKEEKKKSRSIFYPKLRNIPSKCVYSFGLRQFCNLL